MFWFDFAWDIQHVLNQWWWQINFLLLIVFVLLIQLTWKKPINGLALTIVLLPTYLIRSQIWFLPFTYLEICIWAVFLTWFIKNLTTKNSLQYFSNPYRAPIILIIIAATISLFISPEVRQAAGLWKAYFIEPIMLFTVAVNTIKNKSDKETILWALGLSILTISLLAIYQKFSAFGIFQPAWVASDHRRVTSIFSSPNAVGLYLGPIIILYSTWIINDFKKIKATVLKFIIMLPALLAVWFTVSQGTWLGLAAATVFLAFFGWDKKKTILLVIAGGLILFATPVIREKAWPILTFADASGQNRLILISMSADYLGTSAKNFLLGAGILGFADIQNQLRDPLKLEALLYPHNIVLNFWLEIGLLGLIGFGWIIAKFYYKGLKQLQASPDWITLGVLAAMITVLIHGLIDVPYFKNDLAVLFWLIVALL